MSGAAAFKGMKKASNGTAMRPSPKPKAERISVAMKTIAKTSRVVTSIATSAAEQNSPLILS
jgi:hypothetical protein